MDRPIEEYKMWLDELAARERSSDNYRTADLVIAGTPLQQATEQVQESRRLACANNQAAIQAAETLEDRISVIRGMLLPIWTELASRPESVMPRLMYAHTRATDEEVTAEVQQSMNESATFCQALEDAGVEFVRHPELYSPQNTFVQVEHQRALLEINRLQKELETLADDDLPDLEAG